MARLISSMIASLDGFVADEQGEFGWAEPDEEVHRFVNDLARPVGAYLFGRRMDEVMAVWDDPAALAAEPAYVREFGELWRAADKTVYSRKLADVRTGRTRIKRDFVPDEVRRIKSAADRDLSIGGPDLAGQALLAGLVDELQFFVVPVAIGGGKRWLPADLCLELELLDERRFARGTVFLRYAVRS